MDGTSGFRRARVDGLPGTGSLRVALGTVGLLATALGGVVLADTVAARSGPLWVLVLFAGVAVEYVLVGLLAWWRRPSNRTGPLICLCGIALLLADLQNGTAAVPAAVGLIVGVLPIGVLQHILLTFPTGRADSRLVRVLVAAGYVTTTVLAAPAYLFTDAAGVGGVLRVSPQPGLVHADLILQYSVRGAIMLVAIWLLVRRVRSAFHAHRRPLAALYAGAIGLILLIEAAAAIGRLVADADPITVFVIQIIGFALLPVVFTVGILRGGFARTGRIEELGAWLAAGEGGRLSLRDALARALGDDSAQLLFWLPEAERYVDASGAAATLPAIGSERGVVEVESGGERVGAITYDRLLIGEPGIVRAAGRVVALAVERERLTAQLLASHEALRESRARIVEAADRERRRMARDLHDGLQGRLVTLAIHAGRIAGDPTAAGIREQAEQLRSGLVEASDELRRLVQGVMPALLIERGLPAAAADLVDRLPVPTRLELADVDTGLPEHVQTTGYFVLAEALTNAVKHAQPRELSVRIRSADGRLRIEVHDDGVGGARIVGSQGLSGLVDRLEAIGGRLWVDSPLGRGTQVIAEVPCGS